MTAAVPAGAFPAAPDTGAAHVEPVTTPVVEPVPEPVAGLARVSGLGTRAARWALLFVTACGAGQVALLWGGLPHPWLLVAALAAFAVASVLLTRPDDDPLPLPGAVPVAALPVVAAACVLPQYDPSHPERGWLFSFSFYFVGLLAVRGRRLLPWAGAAGALALVAVWALARGDGLVELFVAAVTAVGIVAVATLWRRMLDRHVAALRAHRGAEVRAAVAEDATRAAVAAGAAELAAIGAQAAPLLDRIAAGGTLSAAERTEARLLEARLRDRIRARALAHEPLVGACDAARRAGSDVLLLDDGADARDLPLPVVERIAALVAPVAGGRVTVRVLPPGREALVTVLVDAGGHVRAEAIGPTGTVLRPDHQY